MTRNEQLSSVWYAVLAAMVMALDRMTKNWALTHCITTQRINNYLSYDLVFNRGVSWGMFHSDDNGTFVMVSMLILAVCIGLALHTFVRWQNHQWVIGEVMVLAGACSNLLDRVLHQGVIDFIALHVGWYHFPIFNVADMCIVCGVVLMIISVVRES